MSVAISPVCLIWFAVALAVQAALPSPLTPPTQSAVTLFLKISVLWPLQMHFISLKLHAYIRPKIRKTDD